MKKLIVLLLVSSLAVGAAGCFPFGSIVGRGEVQTRSFDLSGFTRVEAATSFDVEIVRGSGFSVSVTTNENLFEYLDLQRNGDTLLVQLKPGSYTFASLRASITMPDIFSLRVSGASTGSISGFDSNHSLDLRASGASQIELNGISCGDLDAEVSGASRIRGSIDCGDAAMNISGASSVDLAGSGGNIDVTASGASNATLRDLPCANADINFSGASSGTVTASGRLNVQLSGASSLRYYGNPTLGDVNVSGGSSFNKG